MIYINTSFELKNKTGIGAYILTLLKVFDQEYVQYKSIEIKLSKEIKYKYIWQTIWLNTIVYLKCLLNKKTEVFFSPAFIMPYFKVKNTKYITVIHDLCHLRINEMTRYSKFIFDLSTQIAIKKADIIITVSETIKQELIAKYNINPNRVKVVYNSIGEHFINAQFDDDIIKKYNLESKKYILSVATLNKRKNIPELIKAFEQISDKYPDLKLVLVGGMGNEQRENLTQHPKIIFTGYIKDNELPTLYKNALLYMYPSLYEGFGIPLIEAQYCGCPVLCSDIPVFREIGADSVEYCEPTANCIELSLSNILNKPKYLNELSQKGVENVKRFNINNIVKQLEKVIYE